MESRCRFGKSPPRARDRCAGPAEALPYLRERALLGVRVEPAVRRERTARICTLAIPPARWWVSLPAYSRSLALAIGVSSASFFRTIIWQ